uniref:Uncharacterized protein n=2 Tax=Oryza barthii TaxID=65489 RepID=A0A0D3HP79_9ORYZ
MEREQMRMAILRQEQTFRQQVHELHRLYHVQKQLMKQMQIAKLNQAQAIAANAETKPKFEITFAENSTNHHHHHQFYSFQSSKIMSPPAAAAADQEEEEECDLELTLATGSGGGGDGKGKKEVRSSNSDSGTAASSTSTESELAQFKNHHHQQLDCAAAPAARFQGESKKRVVVVVDNEMSLLQPPWLNQCLSLRMAHGLAESGEKATANVNGGEHSRRRGRRSSPPCVLCING